MTMAAHSLLARIACLEDQADRKQLQAALMDFLMQHSAGSMLVVTCPLLSPEILTRRFPHSQACCFVNSSVAVVVLQDPQKCRDAVLQGDAGIGGGGLTVQRYSVSCTPRLRNAVSMSTLIHLVEPCQWQPRVQGQALDAPAGAAESQHAPQANLSCAGFSPLLPLQPTPAALTPHLTPQPNTYQAPSPFQTQAAPPVWESPARGHLPLATDLPHAPPQPSTLAAPHAVEHWQPPTLAAPAHYTPSPAHPTAPLAGPQYPPRYWQHTPRVQADPMYQPPSQGYDPAATTADGPQAQPYQPQYFAGGGPEQGQGYAQPQTAAPPVGSGSGATPTYSYSQPPTTPSPSDPQPACGYSQPSATTSYSPTVPGYRPQPTAITDPHSVTGCCYQPQLSAAPTWDGYSPFVDQQPPPPQADVQSGPATLTMATFIIEPSHLISNHQPPAGGPTPTLAYP